MNRRTFVSMILASSLIPISANAEENGQRLKEVNDIPSNNSSEIVIEYEELTPSEQKDLERSMMNDGELPSRSNSKLASRLHEHSQTIHTFDGEVTKSVFVNYDGELYKYN